MLHYTKTTKVKLLKMCCILGLPEVHAAVGENHSTHFEILVPDFNHKVAQVPRHKGFF